MHRACHSTNRVGVGCRVPTRVATYNVHAGVDGWGRPTRVVDATVALDADVLVLEESWRDDDVDLAGEVAARTGGTAITTELARGWRWTGGTGDESWQPRGALLHGNRGLCLDSVRPISEAAQATWANRALATRGAWCLSIVSRLEVIDSRVVDLPRLVKDRCERRALVVRVRTPRGDLTVVGLHGAHLFHGAIRWYRDVAGILEAHVGANRAAVLGGDLNAWGPLARRLLPRWQQAATGRTWPSWRPHSQIDHLFVRGDIRVVRGGAVDRRESDHRPVVCELIVNH
jgi:endonuclease/exonuclease/phosphatase family metal-dependent hydrolase